MRKSIRIALCTIILALGSSAMHADELRASPDQEDEDGGEDELGAGGDIELGAETDGEDGAGSDEPVVAAPVVTPAAAEALAKARIVFARGATLLAISANGKGEPKELMRLGPASDGRARPDAQKALQAPAITWIAPESRPDMVLIGAGERTMWADLRAGATASAAEPLECARRAHLSPDGLRVACVDGRGNLLVYSAHGQAQGQAQGRRAQGAQQGQAVAQAQANKPQARTAQGSALVSERLRKHTRPAPPSPPLGFDGARRLIVRDTGGVWAVPLTPSEQRVLLAPQAPDDTVLVAPSGELAVGAYAEKNGTALYVFRLDGKAVRRRLMKDAVPVAWSHDSRWLLVQQDQRACLVRASGGEYKCWSSYQGVALAPDGSYALLVKPADPPREGEPALDLYKGRRDGVRPDPPILLVRGVDGPAAWLP